MCSCVMYVSAKILQQKYNSFREIWFSSMRTLEQETKLYKINLVLKNGIKYINDIAKEDGNIYTYDELKTTYNVNIFFLQYSGLIKSGKSSSILPI